MNTVLIIVEQTCLYLPLVLGSYISMSLLKLPDLSIESAYVFGAIFGAQTIIAFKHAPIGLTLFLACLASLIGGACVGATSSLISRLANIPHLLSSIITFGLFHGINQLVLQSSYVSLSGYGNPLELIPTIAQHPELMILIIIACTLVVASIVFFYTQLSYACAMVGNNPDFFKNYGISTNFIIILGVIVANSLAGFSGYLFAQSNSFVEITVGYGKALLCITSLILGKAVVAQNKTITVFVPLIGTIIYFTLQQLLLKVGFNLKYFTAVQALLVLIFIIVLYRAQGRSMRSDQLGV